MLVVGAHTAKSGDVLLARERERRERRERERMRHLLLPEISKKAGEGGGRTGYGLGLRLGLSRGAGPWSDGRRVVVLCEKSDVLCSVLVGGTEDRERKRKESSEQSVTECEVWMGKVNNERRGRRRGGVARCAQMRSRGGKDERGAADKMRMRRDGSRRKERGASRQEAESKRT